MSSRQLLLIFLCLYSGSIFANTFACDVPESKEDSRIVFEDIDPGYSYKVFLPVIEGYSKPYAWAHYMTSKNTGDTQDSEVVAGANLNIILDQSRYYGQIINPQSSKGLKVAISADYFDNFGCSIRIFKVLEHNQSSNSDAASAGS